MVERHLQHRAGPQRQHRQVAELTLQVRRERHKLVGAEGRVNVPVVERRRGVVVRHVREHRLHVGHGERRPDLAEGVVVVAVRPGRDGVAHRGRAEGAAEEVDGAVAEAAAGHGGRAVHDKREVLRRIRLVAVVRAC